MIRRTTLSADRDDLAVLEAEAERRGVSLAHVLREVVADAAAQRRAARPRPRLGVARSKSSTDVARESVEDERSPAAGLRGPTAPPG